MSSSRIFVHRADEAATEEIFSGKSAFASQDTAEVIDQVTSTQLKPLMATASSSNYVDANVVIASESDDCGEIGMAVPLLVMAVAKHAAENDLTVALHVFGIESESGTGRCMIFDESGSLGQPQPLRWWNRTSAGLLVEPVDSLLISSADEVESIFEDKVHYSDLEHLCCECILIPKSSSSSSSTNLLANQVCRVTITCLYMGSNPVEDIWTQSANNLLASVLMRASSSPAIAICSLSSSTSEATKRLDLAQRIVEEAGVTTKSSSSSSFATKVSSIQEAIAKYQEQNVVPSWSASNQQRHDSNNDGDIFMEHLLVREYLTNCSVEPGKMINYSQLSDQMVEDWKRERENNKKKKQQQAQEEADKKKQQEQEAAEKKKKEEEAAEKKKKEEEEAAEKKKKEQEAAEKKKKEEEEAAEKKKKEEEAAEKKKKEEEEAAEKKKKEEEAAEKKKKEEEEAAEKKKQQQEQEESDEADKKQQQQREEQEAVEKQKKEQEQQEAEKKRREKEAAEEQKKKEQEQQEAEKKRQQQQEKEEAEKKKKEQEEQQAERKKQQEQAEKKQKEEQEAADKKKKEEEEEAAAAAASAAQSSPTKSSSSSPHSPIRGMSIWNQNLDGNSSSSAPAAASSSNTSTDHKMKLQEAATQLESDVASKTTDEHTHLKNLYQNATSKKQQQQQQFGSSQQQQSTQNRNGSSTVSQEISQSSSIISISQLAKNKGAKLPPQQVFKSKIVLLGHQEVGKTSVRLCFQSDPFFFKRLPDVQSTTGIEATDKVITIDGEDVDLSVMDFAGQESYHSHTLFLTQRTVFVLVWKISAVEQHFTSRGISEHEEARICRWITEVYSKFPKAPVALCATHLDELRDQSQKSVEAILNKVGNIIQNFIAKISEGKSQMPVVGNFAVSCKNRVFTGTGAHAKLAGSKMSVLLGLLGKVALMNCKADPVFWGGAIPGRHIRLIQEIQELQKRNETMLLSLSDFIKMAVKIGIESDSELLEVSQLMHSWNILYLFNQHKLAANVFIFLHPQWMCKLAGVLFSMAHVINTPLHLRSVIGGLEYGVSNAEGANMGLLETGFLRFPLVRVIFRKTLTTFLERDPHDGDMELCVQILVALELIVRKVIETEDPKVSSVETPSTVPSSERDPNLVTRYFVPSLSPYLVPETLRRLAPLLFPLGVHIKFDFSFLPDEFWWRLQHRMHRFTYPQSMACGEDAEEEEDNVLFQMKEARELHNYWRDGMWLGDAPDSSRCRVLLLREFEPPAIRVFSAASGEFEETCEGLLQEIEQEMSELLGEYKGLQRHVRVECPEQNCFGFFTLANLPSEGSVQCMTCRKSVAVQNICVSGSGPLGRKVFPIELTTELRNVAQRALDDDLCEELMKTVHGEVNEPVDPVRLVDDMLLAFMHREALDIAERRAAKNDSFGF